MHPQRRVNDAVVIERRHPARTRRVVQRLHTVPHELRELRVGELPDVVMEVWIVIPCVVDEGRDGLRVPDLVEQPHGAHEKFHVVLFGEVFGVKERWVGWVAGAQTEGAVALWSTNRQTSSAYIQNGKWWNPLRT